MKFLMNDAVIGVGADGNYSYRTIDQAEAIAWLRTNDFKSTIGYADTANFIQSISGVFVSLSLSRETFAMVTGDDALVVRLRYQLQNPGDKGKFMPLPEDYDFAIMRKIS